MTNNSIPNNSASEDITDEPLEPETSFKIIEEKCWQFKREPACQTRFLSTGHAAMSVISVLGPQGVGKSTLLNKIARRNVFKVNDITKGFNVSHTTRGVDVYATHHRILVDCQPIMSSSVLTECSSSVCTSQTLKSVPHLDPYTASNILDLQLASFLVAQSDYVIIMIDWSIDIHLLRLLSTAIMMIASGSPKAKLVFYSNKPGCLAEELEEVVSAILDEGKVHCYFDQEDELIFHITQYSNERREKLKDNPAKFTAHCWLRSCQILWDNPHMGSLFTDLATQYSSVNGLGIRLR